MNCKPRREWLAVLLTIFQIGLGHIYAGNFKRGILLFFLGQILCLIFAVSLTVVAPNPPYMAFAIVMALAFFISCAADAALIAHNKKTNYEPAKYNRWFVYVGYFAITVLLMQALSSFLVAPYLVQAYMMPTGSMEPALLAGDHILVNRNIYRKEEPKRGEVIVFKYPPDWDVSYVKRLIGKPGDTVEIVDRTVYLNEKPLKEDYARYTDPGSMKEHFGPVRIPPDQYFVLGDNRDNSQDSRHWGFVPRRNLLGKALIVYWSFEISRDLYLQRSRSERLKQAVEKLLHFFGKTRWNRILQTIEQ